MNPIKAARLRAGYTSANKASRALGLDQGGYCRLEGGKVQPSRTMLLRLAAGFQCRTDNLLGLEPLPDLPASDEQAAS